MWYERIMWRFLTFNSPMTLFSYIILVKFHSSSWITLWSSLKICMVLRLIEANVKLRLNFDDEKLESWVGSTWIVTLKYRRLHEWTEITFEWKRFWRYENIVKKSLIEFIATTYANKMHIPFPWLNHKNFKVKYV